MSVPTPTTELVHMECEAFDEENALAEGALTQLRTHFPRNSAVQQVLLKVIALNRLYSTRIHDIDLEVTARHIVSLEIDPLLDTGAQEAVERLANCAGLRKCYSFATKFCSWHNPAAFPIYDGYVDECLWAYRNQAMSHSQKPFADFHRQDLTSYANFVRVITSFRTHYALEAFSFKQLDKFLWRTGLAYWSSLNGSSPVPYL